MVVDRDGNQLMLFIRLLYDHLPRSLVLQSVTEGRLGRSVEHVTRSMGRELMLTCEQQKTSAHHGRQSDDEHLTDTDKLSAAQLQADTDVHALKLLNLFC